MTTYRIVLEQVGPDRWGWSAQRVLGDAHVAELRHGMAGTRDEAKGSAESWITWHHEERHQHVHREVIELEL